LADRPAIANPCQDVFQEFALSHPDPALPRHDWTLDEVEALFALPFTELVFQAASIHRRWFDPSENPDFPPAVDQDRRMPGELRLLQPVAELQDGFSASKLMEVDAVLAEAARAKAGGAQRFCMGAAWREVKDATCPSRRHARGREGHGAGNLHDAGHAGAESSPRLRTAGLDFYTTTSTPDRTTTPASSPRAPIRIGWRRSRRFATRESRPAAAASSVWARRGGTGPGCCTPWPPCRPIPTAYRS